jgi:HK97 gp10 family phage protein
MPKKSVKIIKTNVKAVLDSMSGDRLGRAVMAGAFVLEGAAKMKTPIDTGNLVNSINTVLISSDDTSAFAEVGTGVEYAEHVEFGTSRMQAQPYMRPAFDENAETIKATIQRFAKQQISGATS